MSSTFRYARVIAVVLFVIAVVVAIGNAIRYNAQYGDDDPDRGATAEGMNKPDAMGDSFKKVVYPDQNWKPEESLFFYNTTQGSNLLPYDFAIVLEQAKSEKRFLDNENVNQYRYLPQKPTDSNPDGLPLGFVKDTYEGLGDKEREYMGFTCAACHTNQVNVKQADGSSVAVRVDGGPAMSNMPDFLAGLQKSLGAITEEAAKANPANKAKRERFIQAVLDRNGDYDKAEEVGEDIDLYALRIAMYNTINRSMAKNDKGNYSRHVAYGYARLDAFGRIFNRVIENLQTREQLTALVTAIPDIKPDQVEKIMAGTDKLLSSRNRDEIILRTYRTLRANGKNHIAALREIVRTFRDKVYNYANAPVSYPFLWDIAQHDYVQWNGIAANNGVGPMGRNVGEVIGVFGTLDWHLSDHCSIAAKITGQCSLFGKPTNKEELMQFTSSVDIRNLGKLEHQLTSLESPWWLDENLKGVMPKVDMALAKKGRGYFEERCMMCHHDIVRDDPGRKVVAFMSGMDKVGTDKTMVHNSVGYKGESGLLKDMYVGVIGGGGTLVMQDKMPVASLLTITTEGVVATPDPDKSWLTARIEWLMDLFGAYSNNAIKASNRLGTYPQPNEAAPYAMLQAYKGRPLNGIWATAPYLHNGSVPTLYHVMAPVSERPKSFLVGSRELETNYVGFKYEGYEGGTKFNTELPGNHNYGHEYAACGAAQVEEMKSILGKDWWCEPFDHDKRMAVVEYMKTL